MPPEGQLLPLWGRWREAPEGHDLPPVAASTGVALISTL